VGDTVLQFTAELIINHTRISDYVIRIGGEEILILMPNTSSKGAVVAAEKVRKAIEDATHPIIGKFTASFGVAERNSGEQYQDLYNRVDEALYRAKENGRNCVVEAQSLGGEYAAISFKWNKNWNCNEEIIDEQHKELFRMVSQLAHSSYLKEEKAKVLKYIDDISIYLMKHFKYEEAVLAKVGYQDLSNHKTIHGHLYKRGEEIRNAVENDTMDGMKAFAYIFDELIVGHLLSEDTHFYSYFQPK
jgi:hemerythrin-like metal-binding protein